MALKDVIDTNPKLCKVQLIFDSFDDADKDTLKNWLVNMRPWPLSQALTKYGRPVSEQTVKRHKEQSCSCYRPVA